MEIAIQMQGLYFWNPEMDSPYFLHDHNLVCVCVSLKLSNAINTINMFAYFRYLNTQSGSICNGMGCFPKEKCKMRNGGGLYHCIPASPINHGRNSSVFARIAYYGHIY